MPDTGNFGHEQHPGFAGGGRLPGGWDDALAVLPLDSPDANAWQRLQSRLPVAQHASRKRWSLWLAAAASMALAALIPLRMLPETPDRQGDLGGNAVPLLSADPALAGKRLAGGSGEARQGGLLENASQPAAPGLRVGGNGVREENAAVAARTANPRATQVASSINPRPDVRPADDVAPVAAMETSQAEGLEPLYAQSAQLEGLLTLARDERVASGPGAALTDALDAQVASIDAALIQPDLPSQRRTELWGDRVDTLRQLVGVEATQRLLAARGEQYDAALVSID